MDKVRLGRALGYGTRHAARTLAAVAEAASAPNPAQAKQASTAAAATTDTVRAQATSTGPAGSPSRRAATGVSNARPSQTAGQRARLPSARGMRHAGRSLLGPLATFSAALWLRVTGLFFLLIGLVLASGAWRLRTELHTPNGGSVMRNLIIFSTFSALFLYFGASSFVRANRRERRAHRP